MWFFIFKGFRLRLFRSGSIRGNFQNNFRIFHQFYCPAWNQWPLCNLANWQRSRLFRCKMGVKWLISSRSWQFKPLVFYLSHVLGVTLWHVNMQILDAEQNDFNFFFLLFHEQNFYIDATVWAVCHENWFYRAINYRKLKQAGRVQSHFSRCFNVIFILEKAY